MTTIIWRNVDSEMMKKQLKLAEFVRTFKVSHLVAFDRLNFETLCAKVVTENVFSKHDRFSVTNVEYFTKERVESLYRALLIIHKFTGVVVRERFVSFNERGIFIAPIGDIAPFSSQIIQTRSMGKLHFIWMNMRPNESITLSAPRLISKESAYLVEDTRRSIGLKQWNGNIYTGRGGRDFEGLSKFLKPEELALVINKSKDLGKGIVGDVEIVDRERFDLWSLSYKGRTLESIWRDSFISDYAIKTRKVISSDGKVYLLCNGRLSLLIPLCAELLMKTVSFRRFLAILRTSPDTHVYMRIGNVATTELTKDNVIYHLKKDKVLLPWYIILAAIILNIQ